MSDKRRGVTFWTTILVAVLLGYILSAGPACWASSHWGDGAVVTKVYWPLTRLLDAADNVTLNSAFLWYSHLFARWDYGWATSHPEGKHWLWMKRYDREPGGLLIDT